MKTFFSNLKAGIANRFHRTAITVRTSLSDTAAEGYVDSAMKIIISVVIGGLLLAGLYTLFNGTVIPTLTAEIGEMFDYAG